MNNENRYEDMIAMPHHISECRKHMSLYDRAAQFSPFAALTGHDDALRETARLTDSKPELDESEKMLINEKLQMIMSCCEKTEVIIKYFVPDNKKKGGAYLYQAGFVKKIDAFRRKITMSEGTVIPIDDILDIEFRLSK